MRPFDPFRWWTAAQISQVAGFSVQPDRWRRAGQIFAVRLHGEECYPAYALDPGAGYRPVPVLASILRVVSGKKDAVGLACWFAAVNSFLGGARPQDLLITDPNRVLEAAVDEVQPIAHG